MRETICLSLVIALTTPSWAADPQGNYWQCTTADKEGKQYSYQSSYERLAMARAFEACKKQSRLPTTCQASQHNCDYITNGLTTNPIWQCMALDNQSNPWIGNAYSSKEDATMAAKAYCQQKSPVPDSCYAYMLMCKNINERP